MSDSENEIAQKVITNTKPPSRRKGNAAGLAKAREAKARLAEERKRQIVQSDSESSDSESSSSSSSEEEIIIRPRKVPEAKKRKEVKHSKPPKASKNYDSELEEMRNSIRDIAQSIKSNNKPKKKKKNHRPAVVVQPIVMPQAPKQTMSGPAADALKKQFTSGIRW